jgi:WD40 repeat protein
MKEGLVRSVAFSPDGKTLAAGYNLNKATSGVVLWDVAARSRLSSYPLAVIEGYVASVVFSPDGTMIASGYFVKGSGAGGGGVVLWDVAARKRLGESVLALSEGHVQSVAFSPDGKTIAVGYGVKGVVAGGVVLWDVASRKRLVDEPFVVKEGEVGSVAFSPDGKIIAAGYADISKRGGGGVVLWDTGAHKRLVDEPLLVNEAHVWSVAFSPDGKIIAAGYSEQRDGGGVVLWDVSTRNRLVDEPFIVAAGDSGMVVSPDGSTVAGSPDSSSVAFSPDGKIIAAGVRIPHGGFGVMLWDVDLSSWQRRAGQIANRNLTRQEWREYFPEESYRATFPDLPVPPEVTSENPLSRGSRQ